MSKHILVVNLNIYVHTVFVYCNQLQLVAPQLRCRRILKGHTGKILALDWCSDKRKVVTSSQVGVKFFFFMIKLREMLTKIFFFLKSSLKFQGCHHIIIFSILNN